MTGASRLLLDILRGTLRAKNIAWPAPPTIVQALHAVVLLYTIYDYTFDRSQMHITEIHFLRYVQFVIITIM